MNITYTYSDMRNKPCLKEDAGFHPLVMFID